MCRSYYPHRSRDSLSPVCWIKKNNHSLSPFSPVFFTVFHPFSPFSTAFHCFSKKITVYHCFSLKKTKQFSTFFNHFQPFFLSHYFQPFSTILHRYYYLQTTRDSVSPVCRIFLARFQFWWHFPFGDISVLTTFLIFWYRSFYPQMLRDSVSPVSRIFCVWKTPMGQILSLANIIFSEGIGTRILYKIKVPY